LAVLKLVPQESFCDESKRVPPGRGKNADLRSREYLTSQEIKQLRDAVKDNRYGLRDSLIILMLYKHGLRVSELVSLRWDAIDFHTGMIHINRKKNGNASNQKLSGDEITMLKKLRKLVDGAFIFVSERGATLQRFAVNQMLAAASKKVEFGFQVHPHMLRHAAGYELAKAKVPTRTIQDYLGHKNIQHTVVYTRLDPDAFKGIEDILR
jgi:type 1 fimbriae regulatory protein FimB/type 1 fimbriae regulatory protein FimE